MLQKRWSWMFALAVAPAVAWLGSSSVMAAEWAELTGKFVYDGKPPVPKPVEITKDQEAFGNLGLVDESLLVAKDGGIANVVIYVRTRDVDIHPDIEKSLPKEVKFDNKGGRFEPHILPVWLDKQKVILHNSDPVPHNANVQPLGDEGKNPLLPPNTGVDHQFNRQQLIPVPVACNIHPWMRGFILPRNNPYTAVTAEDGTFTLEKLPAGTELEFQVWHEKSGYLDPQGDWMRGRFTITLKPGKNDLGTIRVDPAVFEKN